MDLIATFSPSPRLLSSVAINNLCVYPITNEQDGLACCNQVKLETSSDNKTAREHLRTTHPGGPPVAASLY